MVTIKVTGLDVKGPVIYDFEDSGKAALFSRNCEKQGFKVETIKDRGKAKQGRIKVKTEATVGKRL